MAALIAGIEQLAVADGTETTTAAAANTKTDEAGSLFDPNGHRVVDKQQHTRAGARFAACLAGGAAAAAWPALDAAQGARVTRRQCEGGLDAFILSNVLTPDECDALVARAEALRDPGFAFWDPDARRADFRSADTVEVGSEELAARLWARIKGAAAVGANADAAITPEQSRWERELDGAWRAYGVNADMLFARYRGGGHFSPHTDGFNVVDFDRRSLYSVIVYLNDCHDGGQTNLLKLADTEGADGAVGRDSDAATFRRDGEGRFRSRDCQFVDACPVRKGTALLFFQDVVHEGEPVGDGAEHEKYIIRTDLMFARHPKVVATDRDREAYALLLRAQALERADGAEGRKARLDEAVRLYKRVIRLSPKLADVYGL